MTSAVPQILDRRLARAKIPAEKTVSRIVGLASGVLPLPRERAPQTLEDGDIFPGGSAMGPLRGTPRQRRGAMVRNNK
jgi:hypothetical protein